MRRIALTDTAPPKAIPSVAVTPSPRRDDALIASLSGGGVMSGLHATDHTTSGDNPGVTRSLVFYLSFSTFHVAFDRGRERDLERAREKLSKAYTVKMKTRIDIKESK